MVSLGSKVGNFIVLGVCPKLYYNKRKDGKIYYQPVLVLKCTCSLGTIIEREFKRVKDKCLSNCNKAGCDYRRRDLTGKVFGSLKVLEIDFVGKDKTYRWKCLCECGRISSVKVAGLMNGSSKSCGKCNYPRYVKHGFTNTKAYHVWEDMKDRCYNPNNEEFRNYGGRVHPYVPIKVCKEWVNDPEAFCKWYFAEEEKVRKTGELRSLQVDRINDAEYYSPTTCRLVDKDTNNLYKRNNIYIIFEGKKESLGIVFRILQERHGESQVSYSIFSSRVKNGWDLLKAFTTVKKE